MAASSRPDMIDKALLRPGRIDKSILCDYPNFEERLETLELYTKKLRADVVVEEDDLDLSVFAKLTEHYSYADLKGLVCNSQLKAIDRCIEQARNPEESKDAATESAQKNDDEEGIINTNNINEDKVYFKQEDILAAFEEMGSKAKKNTKEHVPFTPDDVKRQKQILM